MKVYLCSRIAKDAHDLNNSVASALRDIGCTVFVPHEQHYNQIMANEAHLVSHQEIYEQDMAAMLDADICVVVGRIGVDCAFEIGWFQGRNIPVLYYAPKTVELGNHPMFFEVLSNSKYDSLDDLMEYTLFLQGETRFYEQR